MKTKKITRVLLLVIAATVPTILFSQDPQAYNTAGSLDYFQGEGVIEEWFAENFIYQDFDFLGKMPFLQNISLIGRAVGALGALIYFGWMGAKALAGEGKIEYMPMVKTAIFASLLFNWMSFAQLIYEPFKLMEQGVASGYQNSSIELNALRLRRYEMQLDIDNAFYAKRSEIKAKARESAWANGEYGKAIEATIDESLDKLTQPLEELLDTLDNKIAIWVDAKIEQGCLFVLRLGVYLIFIIKTVFLAFIIAVGPIALGISFFPGFENAFTSWISRFVNISLYGVIAYIILNLCMAIQIAAYKTEIDRYTQVVNNIGEVKNEALLIQMARNPAGPGFGAVDLAYLIGGIAILMTPKLADMVISAGGNAQVAGKAGDGVAKTIKTVTTTVAKAVAV